MFSTFTLIFLIDSATITLNILLNLPETFFYRITVNDYDNILSITKSWLPLRVACVFSLLDMFLLDLKSCKLLNILYIVVMRLIYIHNNASLHKRKLVGKQMHRVRLHAGSKTNTGGRHVSKEAATSDSPTDNIDAAPTTSSQFDLTTDDDMDESFSAGFDASTTDQGSTTDKLRVAGIFRMDLFKRHR